MIPYLAFFAAKILFRLLFLRGLRALRGEFSSHFKISCNNFCTGSGSRKPIT